MGFPHSSAPECAYFRPAHRAVTGPMASVMSMTTLPAELASRGAIELLDERAIVSDLEVIAQKLAGNDRDIRAAVAQRLKLALNEGRSIAERMLLKDRQGRRCSE